MRCPQCKQKLKCQDSREADRYNTIREYGCVRCKLVFSSLETLDKDPLGKKPTKSLMERYKDEKGLCSKQEQS